LEHAFHDTGRLPGKRQAAQLGPPVGRGRIRALPLADAQLGRVRGRLLRVTGVGAAEARARLLIGGPRGAAPGALGLGALERAEATPDRRAAVVRVGSLQAAAESA